MKIIVAGDGETGTHIARTLSVEGQDVVLMGTDHEHLAELDSISNFITFEGSPLSRYNLKQCGAENADLFVAVTPNETGNLIACQIAKDCGTFRCVARVDNPDFDLESNRQLFRRTGVDMTIYPEKLAAVEIKHFIKHNWVNDWIELHQGALIVAGVRMLPDGVLCGKSLNEVPNNPRKFHVSAIKRGNEIIIPRGEDRLLEGDTIYFSVLPENCEILPELCGKKVTKTKRIMICGAGRVTENLLELICHDYDITVIDPDKERCNIIASRFKGAVAVNSRVNDVVALEEEGIDQCDMFLALTGSSETNIVSCMVAREHGVGKTVARIEELQYMPEAESLSIDKIINKKLLNAGKILSVLLDCNMATAQCISLGTAEITELIATADSKIISAPISQLSLPRGITIGGIIRNKAGMLAEGSTQINPGDHVVVFYAPGSMTKLNRFFR